MSYILSPSQKFKRKLQKRIKNDRVLEKKALLVLDILANNPFYPSLKTHKVNDVNGQENYSSRLTGDLQIIWNFANGKAEIIDLIDIGGHSGGNKIYN